MFTGIVEIRGHVVNLVSRSESVHLEIEAGLVAEDAKPGDSVAVNGCCLTVVEKLGSRLVCNLLQETLRCTNLQYLQTGSVVNLERALRADMRFGGHFVTGHIDAMGCIRKWEQVGSDFELVVSYPAEYGRFLVPKGCIAVDGMSLTVVNVSTKDFSIWIIPHTREVSTLSQRTVGSHLNLEFDLLAKYVQKLS